MKSAGRLKVSNVKIRKALQKDLSVIVGIEKQSYPPELQAPATVLRQRLESFGIWVAERKGNVIGFFTCVPIELNWPKPSLKSVQKNRNPHYQSWFEAYVKNPKNHRNTLYVTSTAVKSSEQGKGVGKLLILYSLSLAKKHKLSYRASVLRIPGFHQFQKKTKKGIHSYVRLVNDGECEDRFLRIYQKLGFTLGSILPNYEKDRASENYGVFAYKKL